jgi:hypothetical protein
MAKRDNAVKSNQRAAQAAEAARNNPLLADSRKRSETFRVLAECYSEAGKILPGHTGQIVGAALLDYFSDTISETDTLTTIKGVDSVLKEEVASIARGLLEMKLTTRAKRTRLISQAASTPDELIADFYAPL